tara:strand:- start:620 stop:1546 length:927 start_codon:yes stop_codon:yes gene_type:complete
MYASIPSEALNYPNKRNLVGFGFAPEGIENNEIIYELLSDVAWTREKIDLDDWVQKYSLQRYGSYPASIKEAYDLLNKSAFGTFTDHPMHRYQFRPYNKPEGVEDHATVHHSTEFGIAVDAFLKDGQSLKNNPFYTYDAIEMVTQYLGLVVDQKLLNFLAAKEQGQTANLDEIINILLTMDRLLLSHPNRNLEDWLTFARKWGDTPEDKDYYEANARKLITTWGGEPINDYAGRIWSGLIRDYYASRWQAFHKEAYSERPLSERKADMRKWEERWINASGVSEAVPFADPISVAQEMYEKYKSAPIQP